MIEISVGEGMVIKAIFRVDTGSEINLLAGSVRKPEAAPGIQQKTLSLTFIMNIYFLRVHHLTVITLLFLKWNWALKTRPVSNQ
jgi:hypothetical protein